MKTAVSILVISIITFAYQNSFAQTSKKNTFNKENAYIWLNSKLELDPNDSGFDDNEETESRSSTFSSCTYSARVRRVKVLWPSPNKELYSNTIQVSLKDLNPNSLKIERFTDKYNDKFSIIANTTNSLRLVTREIFGANREFQESRREADVSFGPFPNSLDESTKLKIMSVIRQLITSCGGKDDLF